MILGQTAMQCEVLGIRWRRLVTLTVTWTPLLLVDVVVVASVKVESQWKARLMFVAGELASID
jgi:hypothetical protein